MPQMEHGHVFCTFLAPLLPELVPPAALFPHDRPLSKLDGDEGRASRDVCAFANMDQLKIEHT